MMGAWERGRIRRQKMYEGLFGAQTLCAAGLLMMPALLFNPDTGSRIIQFLFFWFLTWLAGKKNNPLVTIVIITGIVLCNLIIPYGNVLFSVGAFTITGGALDAGIRRAVTLEGLIMLSRCTIRHDLRIPGAFGALISESFRIFERITSQKYHITRRNCIADIDRLLMELSEDETAADTDRSAATAATAVTAATQTRPLGFCILALAALLSWLLVFRR